MEVLKYGPKLLSNVHHTLETVFTEELSNLDHTASLIVDNFLAGGVLHMFGAGHSHLFCEEMAYRAGGLVPVNTIMDIGYTLMGNVPSQSTRLERLDGFIETVMDGYIFKPNEIIIILSQSGRNPGPVGAAIYAKEKGLQVVAITSVSQSRDSQSRHKSGKRLFELADVVIDSHVPHGDASVEISPEFPKVAPLSTIIGSTILQFLVAEVAGRILEEGETPPVWVSSNIDGGDAHNQKMVESYQPRFQPF